MKGHYIECYSRHYTFPLPRTLTLTITSTINAGSQPQSYTPRGVATGEEKQRIAWYPELRRTADYICRQE